MKMRKIEGVWSEVIWSEVAKGLREDGISIRSRDVPAEVMEAHGVFDVVKTDPPEITETQVLDITVVDNEDGRPRESWAIRDLTPEDIAVQQAKTVAKRIAIVKAECGRRIYAVASDNAQKNTLGAYTIGTLTEDERVTFEAGLGWIRAMQAACLPLISDQALDPSSAEHWLDVPLGVKELADLY